MIPFFAGLLTGAAVGMLIAALVWANNDDDCSRGHPA